MITFKDASKRFANGAVAVDSLDLEIDKGEFFVLIGPSGCGKTTTLKMINRLIPLSDGTVWIKGKRISDYDIHELRWSIGYVLQQIGLFPHMTIAENIAVVPELKQWDKQKIKARVDELLHMVGLEPSEYRDRKPHELSGGQQQRIGVLRALAADPEILLMDEPFSALDPFSREKLQDDLLDIQRKIKKTIVFVTHDMQEAVKLGDRICLMKDGKIVQLGTPQELISNPVNDFVREFVGEQAVRFDWEKLVTPHGPSDIHSEHTSKVTLSTPLHEVLEHFSEHELLNVEDQGQFIGTIRRQQVLEELADQLKKRGQLHE
ncbi:osmoprotectant transport system ATP-binding protein [Paenibacillus shirakamiensis]|uniref:Quaternary amine transport ATP-binding protein n=1 Tax=Paenibacillus shirakamiensis TaxID=1265935 RepID=A0ABS4JGP6_9BACL|nr:osmoprotectant update ABC transporter ATP-binding subunit OpuFA [Paenibacillus shirakamiensis]MBP2000126.1 osmoprotectant transport system ATP-binding protein [Paenibacillus shirakamiensis]